MLSLKRSGNASWCFKWWVQYGGVRGYSWAFSLLEAPGIWFLVQETSPQTLSTQTCTRFDVLALWRWVLSGQELGSMPSVAAHICHSNIDSPSGSNYTSVSLHPFSRDIRGLEERQPETWTVSATSTSQAFAPMGPHALRDWDSRQGGLYLACAWLMFTL